MIESFYWHDDTLEESDDIQRIRAWRGGPGSLWVNLHAPSDEELEAILTDVFDFHPLCVEDCRHASKYPKVDVIEGRAFAVMLSPKTTVPTRGEFFMRELDLFLTPNAVVSVPPEPLQAVGRLRDQLSKTRGAPLSQGPDAVFHALVDVIADRYLLACQAIEDRSEVLEHEAAATRPEVLEELLDLKTSTLEMHQIVKQTRGSLRRITGRAGELIDESRQVAWSDLDDHLGRALDLLRVAGDSLRNGRDHYFAAVQVRTNTLLQLLAALVLVGLLLGLVDLLRGFGVAGP